MQNHFKKCLKCQLQPFRAHMVAWCCLHKSCKTIRLGLGPLWSTMISWYPVACLSALFTLVHTQCIRETAAACDRRFCSSSVSRTRRCDSCSKSLTAANLEMQLVKRTHFFFFKEMFKPNCGKTIQDSRQVLPNSNSCLGEPGLKFFGFACTSLTLLVGVLTVFTISWPELEVAGQPISR